jgi:hypothetical protein
VSSIDGEWQTKTLVSSPFTSETHTVYWYDLFVTLLVSGYNQSEEVTVGGHDRRQAFRDPLKGDGENFPVPTSRLHADGRERRRKRSAPPLDVLTMPVDWEHSAAKKFLVKDLKSGLIPLEPNNPFPRVLWAHYSNLVEFADVSKTQFSTNIQNLRKLIKQKKDRSAEEEAALTRDRLHFFPRPPTNHRGEPHWDCSASKPLLSQDIDAGKHNDLEPRELWMTRPEYYQEYPNHAVFRKHIYQEIRTRKFRSYLEFKAKHPKAWKLLNPNIVPGINDSSDEEDYDRGDDMSL